MAIDIETALITGGAHGIGLACAKALSRSGSNIVLLDKDNDALAQAKKAIFRPFSPYSGC
jgi:NAD(P)-dependent dehydrogenase (short-subunit alcohol dehydrogenase family)